MQLIFGLLFLALGVYLILSKRSVAPWFPTKSKDLERINKLANLQKGEKFFDLGCGEGKVCRYLAKNNPFAEVVGIESSYIFYIIAKMVALFRANSNLTIRLGDVFKEDLTDVDVIYTFAFTDTINGKLKDKIMKDMKHEARLISYAFSISSWDGESITDSGKKGDVKIHIYKKR